MAFEVGGWDVRVVEGALGAGQGSLDQCWSGAKVLAAALARVSGEGHDAHRVRLARAHALALVDVIEELLLAE